MSVILTCYRHTAKVGHFEFPRQFFNKQKTLRIWGHFFKTLFQEGQASIRFWGELLWKGVNIKNLKKIIMIIMYGTEEKFMDFYGKSSLIYLKVCLRSFCQRNNKKTKYTGKCWKIIKILIYLKVCLRSFCQRNKKKIGNVEKYCFFLRFAFAEFVRTSLTVCATLSEAGNHFDKEQNFWQSQDRV